MYSEINPGSERLCCTWKIKVSGWDVLVWSIHSTLEHLFRNKWLDMYTRAVIVEFTVYNANVNLFCIVTLLLENTAAGEAEFLLRELSFTEVAAFHLNCSG